MNRFKWWPSRDQFSANLENMDLPDQHIIVYVSKQEIRDCFPYTFFIPEKIKYCLQKFVFLIPLVDRFFVACSMLVDRVLDCVTLCSLLCWLLALIKLLKEGQYTQIINPFLLLNLLLLIDFFSPLLHHFRLTF